MRKKHRILLVGEASFLSTGFARHGYEVLSRLHDSGKYEMGELATYCSKHDSRIACVPWKFYVNSPDEKDAAEFNSCQDYVYGGWIFDDASLDFRQTITLDLRDPWCSFFEESSPARHLFHHVLAPTVDSAPYLEQFLAHYMQADGVFTYSEFGRETLAEQSGGRIKWKGHIPHAADTDIFKPLDKIACRRAVGFDDNALIALTIMRNQRRKCYPNVLKSFRAYLDRCTPDVARRSKLHLHCQASDMAWDIPKLITENGLSNHVVLSHHCPDCGRVFVAPFQDPRVACVNCGSMNVVHPGVNSGITREALATIYNCADCHLNIAIAEGFGTCQVEASACGLKNFSTDYSAMRDVCRNVLGTPVPYKTLFREAETHAWRAYPDDEALTEELLKWLGQPESERASWVPRIREATMKHYTADKTAKTLMDYLDSVPIIDKWDIPPRFHTPQRIPKDLPPTEYVKAGLTYIAGRPDLIGSFMALRCARDLERGRTTPSTAPHFYNDMSAIMSFPMYRPYTYDDAEQDFLMMCENHNNFEKKRTAKR